MKSILLIVAFIVLASNAFSQSISDVSTAITLSPFVTATKLLETSAVATLRGVQSTMSMVQSRGVAGKEQLKDELLTLNEAMSAGHIKSLMDIPQAGLRELFEEIMTDERQVEEISLVVQDGPLLYRIATVVTIALLTE